MTVRTIKTVVERIEQKIDSINKVMVDFPNPLSSYERDLWRELLEWITEPGAKSEE